MNAIPDSVTLRKILLPLVLGVVITLLAAFFNYMLYHRRLPARAVAGSIAEPGGASPNPRGESPGPVYSVLRSFARLVNVADDFAQEMMFTVRGNAPVADSTLDEIAVIGIDADSIIRHGSWPWPSSTAAMLLDKAADAKVIALDALFPAPDRTSLRNFVERFDALYSAPLDVGRIRRENRSVLLDNDEVLARHISQTPTVLAAAIYNGRTPPTNKPKDMLNPNPPEVVLPDGTPVPQEDVLLKGATWALTNIPALRGILPPPPGEGFLNLFPGPGGVLRSIPLFAHVAGEAFLNPSDTDAPRRIAPSIALELIRVAVEGTGYRINLRGDIVNIPEFRDDRSNGDRYPVAGVTILRGAEEIMSFPLNELAEMEIGFQNHTDDFRVYPAWEVMEGRHDGAFRGKLVLIGTTVGGVGYVVSSGPSNTGLSIPEAHAAMISGVLRGDVMDAGYRHDFFWQQAAILVLGLLVTAAVIVPELPGGMIVALAALAGWVFTNYFVFFRRDMDVGITLPVVSTVTVFVVLTIANYLMVGKERRFIRKAFQQSVSPSILGYLETHPDKLTSLEGDYRHMTVLFTDIRGFTTISENLSAPDVARLLNEYFTPMSDIVMNHAGTVDKFIGDGMMAFWNAPADNPRHARDAALSALGMLEKLAELQEGWTSRGLPQIAIGLGINTGPMFAGYMGSERRKNYTVMGDSVNIASRIEELNKTYSSGILITESTRAELGKDFICRVVDKVRVSGKASAVLIYELLGHGAPTEEQAEEFAAFRRVFELYQEREFATAESLLKELVFIRPAPLYKMYLDRLAVYKALPPPPDWDGTFVAMHK